jgi:hypothetical protein
VSGLSAVGRTVLDMKGCGKHAYRDRISALIALANMRHKDCSHRTKMELRAYRCWRFGGAWHLTSRSFLAESA